MKLVGNTNTDFEVTDEPLLMYSAFVRYWRKRGSILRQHVSYVYMYNDLRCVTPWLESASELCRPTERPPLVGEVSAKCRVVSATIPPQSLISVF
jgi:hypothetical protein